MAHFAKIENSLVTQVIVTDNDYPGEGYEWLMETFGGTWVQTSYNARIRGKFAAIGDTYDEVRDIFIAPQPFPSWTFNTETNQWDAPITAPEGFYLWDEETLTWKEAN